MDILKILTDMSIMTQCLLYSFISIVLVNVIKKYKKLSVLDIYSIGILITFIFMSIVQALYFKYVIPHFRFNFIATVIDLLCTSIMCFTLAMIIYDKIKQLKEDEKTKEQIKKFLEKFKKEIGGV